MYEARQNKEKVSRRIDGGSGMARQRVKRKNLEVIKATNSECKSNHIQRKIGFEFETGWMVSKKKGFLTSILSKDKFIRLSKGEKIYNGSGFTVEADDASKSESEIEFVTPPFNSISEVQNKVQNIVLFVKDCLLQSADQSNEPDKSFIFQEKYKIIPPNNYDVIKAGPQVTFGLPLNGVPNIIKGISPIKNSEYRPNLNGLVILIKSYLNNGKQNEYARPLYYPKEITDSGMLARTNFVKLFKIAIERDNLNKYGFFEKYILWKDKKDNHLSIEDWLGMFNDFDLDNRVFGNGILAEEEVGARIEINSNTPYSKARKYALSKSDYRITIKKWLTEIYNESKDILSTIKDSESLGALGEKTEEVADNQEGIFELRKKQGNKIPHTQWLKFAKKWTHKVAKLSHADINDLSSAIRPNIIEMNPTDTDSQETWD
ncbi:hypothetical protein [Phocaeicola plebeius]|uniref:hypothetical protein n=3 Tax=Phocaeicola plebeius TaxID=310297 RepID=UPI0021AD0E74|nr:hypothetical protein [Phocaeicola plebeius]MCR8882508.1 hypothetical protein [Phocaeicola plebeius]